jgi:hypothetical protein
MLKLSVLKYKLKILIYVQPRFVPGWRNYFNPFSTNKDEKVRLRALQSLALILHMYTIIIPTKCTLFYY